MSFISESLSLEEEVKTLFTLSWVAKMPMYICIFLAIPTLGITVLPALFFYYKFKCTELGVTNKRVILKTGIYSRKSEEMKISSIETVEINQTIFGRLLDFGTIKVTGKGVSDVIFKNIDDPMAVKIAIESV